MSSRCWRCAGSARPPPSPRLPSRCSRSAWCARLLTRAEIAGLTLGGMALIVATWVPPSELFEGHRALNRADERLKDLLTLKKDHECPPRPTAHPDMNDLEVLAALEVLMDTGSRSGSERERLRERTRLLDGLRAVN